MKRDGLHLAGFLLAYMLMVPLAFLLAGALVDGCYAHTGPVPSCADDPSQPGCYPPIHDARDAGR